MEIEYASVDNSEGFENPKERIVKPIECSKLSPGDLILTTVKLDTAKIIEVKNDVLQGTTRLVYTVATEAGKTETSYQSNRRLLMVVSECFN